VKAEQISRSQGVPIRFLENIMVELRHGGLVCSQRGIDGGHWLSRPADEISVAQVFDATRTSLMNVRGRNPATIEYRGTASAMRDVWAAVDASLRYVLEEITLADIVAGKGLAAFEAATGPDTMSDDR
jgi:Rrf2 family protein